jgi:site-specific recombinase XerD
MSGTTRRKPGELGPFVAGYESWLLALGYAPGSVRHKLKELGQLGRWMASQEVCVARLDAGRVEEFLASRRATGCRRVPVLRSFAPLLGYLTDAGVITAPAAVPATPLEELISRYRSWLVTGRGLAPATVLRYENLARRFLAGLVRPGEVVQVEGLSGTEVTAFLLAECGRVSVGSAKGRVAELRALLRFMYLQGMTPRFLAAAVPPVAGWRDTTVPSGMTAADMERLLASCDRSAVSGLRNYAILMLLARLGLRSAEVARLELGDLDWRAGEIIVRGKARREDRLPLLADVGGAIAGYLSATPDRTGHRAVFLTVRAPVRPIRPDLVGDVVERTCLRAGLPPAGAHRLRHGLATEMLRQGATLIDISQVLRHSDLATTALYAKVDLARLRQVARPWPGASR